MTMTVLARELPTGNEAAVPVLGLGGAQQITLTSSASAASVAVGSGATVVTVWATVDFYVATGANPTAATSGFAWPASTPLDVKVVPGVTKVAGRGVSAAGTLYMVERT
jgi:hypothetical protein